MPDAPVLVATSLVDHDDEPVNLGWSPEQRAYGYFSPAAGWVTVDSERLQVFRFDANAFLGRVTSRLDLPRYARPAERIPRILWELGDVRLPGAEAVSRSGMQDGSRIGRSGSRSSTTSGDVRPQISGWW